ncbi:hypothetical protein FHW67_002718 [Herbaspirillum sp. Sphag1AN]|uniref:hypothetical protein n=1 Tax=unclassified Herbaspirillum TaxID=2624150 RepID=UPI00161E4AE7|nr:MULTISPECIES: hypothetical protein [unclassified Herbaspirillum]MBB3213426.1 hypothetical protein [Herbaspirillum sp. Sphag1AN]MBB3246530.1 hypothetical protein [Herbaspirillum sp. Sphag64]
MREFSLQSFALQLAVMEVAVRKHVERGLERVAAKVEKTAKDEVGHYLEAVGPFPAWEELAESTKEDRVAKGYTENDPGLRSGAMRDSIQHSVEGLNAQIGSDDDKLVWFELGTSKQPPRPVLGPAVERNHEDIGRILGHATVTGLLGGQSLPAHLEYDHDV